MDTTMVATRWHGRQPLAALGKLTAAALVGMAFLLGYVTVKFGFFPPVLVFMAAALILGGIVATGWRWAPLLGALVYGGLLALAGPFVPYALSHPNDTFMFVLNVFFLALAIVGIGAGIGATVQNCRRAERRAPRGLAAGLAGLGGLALGAILVAAIPQAGSSTGVSPEALAALPSLTTADFRFDQAVIRAKVGETVRIYFGVGGPNVTSSFHVIGEVFDKAYPFGSMTSEPLTNVQTITVPPGGAAVVDFKVEVPGKFILVDHALSRLEKGLVGILKVEGPENPEVFKVIDPQKQILN